MFQYIRSVRVEYVVRISSITSLYIGHWKVFENISLADRQTDTTDFHLPKQKLSSTNLEYTVDHDLSHTTVVYHGTREHTALGDYIGTSPSIYYYQHGRRVLDQK